jgi:hypothetical protein
VPIIPIAGGAREVLSRSAHVLSDVPSAMRQQLAPVLDVRSPSLLIYQASPAKLTRVRAVCAVCRNLVCPSSTPDSETFVVSRD